LTTDNIHIGSNSQHRLSGQVSTNTAQAIWNWVRQADRDEGRRQDGATSTEREELTRLRRENRRLRQERDIYDVVEDLRFHRIL
jgi:transposase-like protein